jgi:RNA-directed DNA polymerase
MTTDRTDGVSPVLSGGGGTDSGGDEVQQISLALNEPEDLATKLMERVCERANLNQAYKRVKANKGASGVDGMTVQELLPWMRQHSAQLLESLLTGSYRPQPVREVEIPKPGKRNEKRKLGIPTVLDRVIQQALHQVLEPIFDPSFSASSYGFRPGRSAHDALKQARTYVETGYDWVVDMDLEQFFDRVNHDVLMSRVARKVKDKRVLKLIRRYLEAGILRNGVGKRRHQGTPQGGPLSPLLSNILLDELDRELEKRGHKFCRYADDQNIYVRSKRAGERVYGSIKGFLEKRLKLKVNDSKSAVGRPWERTFLGYCIDSEHRLRVSPVSLARAKDKIRQLTQRGRGVSFARVIGELNAYLRGWFNYYRLSGLKSLWRELDSWIRRKLRCYKLRQKKRGSTIARYLMSLGIPEIPARQTGASGKGWWCLSRTKAVHRALSISWFDQQNLTRLEQLSKTLLKA